MINTIHQTKGTHSFVHVRKQNNDSNTWTAIDSTPNNPGAFNATFSGGKRPNAKAMAIYAAYLFEKLVYGDNFPKTEYNRKLEVIKTLPAKDIEFVNKKVAGKLEKVYTPSQGNGF